MIVGVGGQGSLLASKMLGHLLVNAGYDVKVSEVHGMSQRGGSVVTYVRFGDKVYSPIIDKGEADFIVSFELLEAARWIEYLKPTGQIVTNTQQMEPMPVIAGLAKYPEDLVDKMRAKGIKVDAMDCLALGVFDRPQVGGPGKGPAVSLRLPGGRRGLQHLAGRSGHPGGPHLPHGQGRQLLGARLRSLRPLL